MSIICFLRILVPLAIRESLWMSKQQNVELRKETPSCGVSTPLSRITSFTIATYYEPLLGFPPDILNYLPSTEIFFLWPLDTRIASL